MLFHQPASVIFTQVAQYLFKVTPADDVIAENAEATVKLIKHWLGDHYEPFLILVEFGEDEYRNHYFDHCAKTGFDRSICANVPDVCFLFRDKRLVCLTNLCTLSIDCMQKLSNIEQYRHNAYNAFVADYQSDYAPSSVGISNFLCSIIQNRLFIDCTLDELKLVKEN